MTVNIGKKRTDIKTSLHASFDLDMRNVWKNVKYLDTVGLASRQNHNQCGDNWSDFLIRDHVYTTLALLYMECKNGDGRLMIMVLDLQAVD